LAESGRSAILAAHPAADGSKSKLSFNLENPLMSSETLEFILLLSGWMVTFLLGRELLTGIGQMRLRLAEQRVRRED
jgi:hypothetical protein